MTDTQKTLNDKGAALGDQPPLKRTLTPDNIIATVANLAVSGPILLEAAVKPRIPTALREKIFLAVTSVNDCRYCKWLHTRLAMAQGVSLEEVNKILSHQMELPEAENVAEAAAILFARHYAEQLDQVDPESIENLRKLYGDADVAEILAYVRFITFANLTGNTVDVFFDRFRSSLLEGAVAAAGAPLALILTQLASLDRQVPMDPMRSHRQEFHQDRRPSKPGVKGKR